MRADTVAVVEAAAVAVAVINTPKSPFFMILSGLVYICCFFQMRY
jgi:hypothetical protein